MHCESYYKPLNMEVNKILNADILDIVFEGRNKAYGAYQLRKTYNRRLGYALSAMFGICLLATVGSVLGKTGEKKKAQTFVQDVNIASIREEKPTPPPVTPPPPKDPPKVEIKKFTPPVIVDHEVKEPPPTQSDLEDVKTGPISQEGIKSDVVAPPVEEKSTGVVAAPRVEEDYTGEFKTVQIQASFPGGPEAWQKYLQRNLRAEVAGENGASAGRYTVVVSFLVDRDGNISEVKAENDPGYGTSDEAVRVIQRGPKWKPAVQNGRNVIYRQRQTVVFEVPEG